jgi:hypothetical protein
MLYAANTCIKIRRLGVIFINVLRTRFSYKSLFKAKNVTRKRQFHTKNVRKKNIDETDTGEKSNEAIVILRQMFHQ